MRHWAALSLDSHHGRIATDSLMPRSSPAYRLKEMPMTKPLSVPPFSPTAALIIIGLFAFGLQPHSRCWGGFCCRGGRPRAVALVRPGLQKTPTRRSRQQKILWAGPKVAVLLADQGPFISRTAEGSVCQGWQNYLMSAHDAAGLAIHPDLHRSTSMSPALWWWAGGPALYLTAHVGVRI